MKKFISFALAASMALSMIPATAFASSDLTTSHSNIRVTASTEFKPAGEDGADDRDIPYILLEAKSDFLNEKQTFEVALENAEWLETDADSDVLYVEDEDIMEDYVQFVPENSTSTSSAPTATPSASVPTQDIGVLERAYQTKANALYNAAEAYAKELEKAGTADPSAAQKVEDARAELKKAEAALDAAQKVYEPMEDYTEAGLTELVNAFEAAVSAAPKTVPLLVNDPDDDKAANENTGKYKGTIVADSYTSYYYVKKSDGNPFTVTGENSPITYDEIKAGVEAALGKGEIEVNNNYVTDKNSYNAYAKEKKLWDDAQTAIKNAQDAGLGVTTDATSGKKVVESVASAMARKQEASDNVDKAKTTVEAAKAKLAEAEAAVGETGNVAALKADFNKALKERNEAGVALISKAGSNILDKIVIMDKTAKLATGNTVSDVSYHVTYIGNAAANKVYFDDVRLGIKKITLTTVAGEYEASGLLNKDGTKSKLTVEINKKSDSRIIVNTSGYKFRDGDVLRIPLFVRTTGGVASVSIDSLNSEFTSEGKTFARTSDGDTNLTIEKTQSFYDGDEIKNIYIEELVPGTIEDDGVISLRVNGDFLLRRGTNFKVERITGNYLKQDLTNDVYTDAKCTKAFAKGNDTDEIYIEMSGSKSTQAAQYRITGLLIVEDGADFGDEATLTVSGGGTSKQTVTIGTYEDYGVKMTAEDKDLPVIYAGTKASSKYDNQTLKVTIEETVANSFIDNRKMELTLPDGVEFVNDNGEARTELGSIDDVTEDFKIYNFKGTLTQVKNAFTVDKDGGKITISSKDLGEAFDSSGTNKDRKRRIEFSLHVSAEADFTGDVVLTLNGPAVANQEVSATIATVKAPIEVKTTVNELKIDYRNTEVADITLVEPEAGLWAKNDIIRLEGERMSFEGGAKAEVVSGDMKLDKLGGDYVDTEDSGDDRNGVLFIKVDSRSSKTPAEIKLSGLSLYMNRSLAAGDYKLKVFGDEDNEFFMNNYDNDGDDYANSFETRKVTVMNDFVKVVTAGREVDDATFTTTIVVPIGSDTITAGSREIKLSEMAGGACPAAYINNDGYTMLPVRAVTEALNSVASVRWDDATKTCTIGFGQRVFSMTVGSKVLNMNGVSTPLNAAPEIRDGRVFLPLRDLGYALGLSENKISWDATTQTAKLN